MTSPSIPPSGGHALSRVRGHVTTLAPAGSIGGAILFALSLFPSLLPRTILAQGIISGVMAAVGYGLGTLAAWTWRYLGLPSPRGRPRGVGIVVVGGALGLAVGVAVWQHVGWQNEVRQIMGIPPTTPATWPPMAMLAAAVATGLVVLARAVRRAFTATVARLARRLPPRLARAAGTATALVVVWGLWSGVLVTGFFALANRVSTPRDAATEVGVTRPTAPTRSGSTESLVAWDTLGRKGRSFVATGPTIADLEQVSGRGAVEPIRVYAGLKSADTSQGRADLVLAELQRTGGFERDVLVVATTTGTGFLDPHGVDPLEYLHNGNTAIVGVQYSYLPSWISLLADQDAVKAEARVVFDTIHAAWSQLPDATRPRLYLYGMSLGSLGVEAVLTSANIINEPIDGALLVGPPFVDTLHDQLIDTRNPDTPPWLPVVDSGRTMRFMARGSGVANPTAQAQRWGPTRIVYLQNSSDPVVWFDPEIAFEHPDWLADGQRGPDVSDDFIWTPMVTMWQVLLDLPAAGTFPDGYGHNYTVADNVRAWAAITRADGWTDADTQALMDHVDPPGPP